MTQDEAISVLERALDRVLSLRETRRWMTLEEVAGHLRVGVQHVRKSLPRWVAAGLVARREKDHGPWIVDRASLDRMVEHHWR